MAQIQSLMSLYTHGDESMRAYLTMIAFEAEIDRLDELTEVMEDRWTTQPFSQWLQERVSELRTYWASTWPPEWQSLPEPPWRRQRGESWTPRIRFFSDAEHRLARARAVEEARLRAGMHAIVYRT